MVGRLSLDGTWQLKGTDGHRGSIASYCAERVDERTFVEAHVPGEVHLDLMRLGQIGDVRVGTEALRARWVEEQYWIYRRRFTPPDEALQAQRCWLVFESLDLVAEVYLNGERVGSHDDLFYPCRIDVTSLLRAGENLLAVALDAGLHAVGDKPGAEYLDAGDTPLHKRHWLRKPQYQFAWDWNPRLINVGIERPVRLEWCDTVRIEQVAIYPELAVDQQSADIVVRWHVENVTAAPLPVELRASVPEAEVQVQSQMVLPTGHSTQATRVSIAQPRLWWPRPHGEQPSSTTQPSSATQPLYTVVCELWAAGRLADCAERRTGIRSVRIRQEPHPVAGEYFCIEVNGEPIFCKGGNWVPADMLYAAVDRERYRALIDRAVAANFNTLRVWGGGLYVDHDFLELCDEAGIMVWHDCIFACSRYPGGDAAFLANVRNEITYVVRELSPHPSLLVWCGNNEIEWGDWEWGYDATRAMPDYALFHLEIPRILRREDPSRPYWPSSPYSPDQQTPNSPLLGDQHPWHVSIGENGPNYWAYRGDVSRFPNEGGALGCSSPATLRQFLPENERHYLSPSWEYHDNEIAQHADGWMSEDWFAYWLGIKPATLALEDYAYYSGALQAEALVEYANNFRRRMWSSASAIFWMYNDSWPVTHGWTIVDYYLRRKLAYHPVRRAFDPLQIIPAIEGDEVLVYGVNDTFIPWSGEARFGALRLDGAERREWTAPAELAPNAATLVGRFALDEWRQLGTTTALAYATLWQGAHLLRQNRLLLARHKELIWPRPAVRVWREGDRALLSSDTFAWGVCLDLDGESDLPDDMLDLLPGLPWSLPWPQDRELPRVQRVGNLGW